MLLNPFHSLDELFTISSPQGRRTEIAGFIGMQSAVMAVRNDVTGWRRYSPSSLTNSTQLYTPLEPLTFAQPTFVLRYLLLSSTIS